MEKNQEVDVKIQRKHGIEWIKEYADSLSLSVTDLILYAVRWSRGSNDYLIGDHNLDGVITDPCFWTELVNYKGEFSSTNPSGVGPKRDNFFSCSCG
jgi:hypothetical protein